MMQDMSSLALLTDLYQLTMAYGYWKLGIADRRAVFHLFFRRPPFGGPFAVAAGMETALAFIEKFQYRQDDLDYLAALKNEMGQPIFEPAFLEYLKGLRISCTIDAVAEGTPMFPKEPLLRVEGPLLQAQLLESPLLNIINFQTLIATKTARMVWAARPDPVIEFGLRRAQGVDGAISASRAAYIGGCTATSNVLAGKLYGIPVKGTHAHSWVMSFDTEEEALRAYAEILPGLGMFLVDTYDSIAGAKKVIALAQEKQGFDLLGVRLDSGDLTYLSIEIRRLLDAAGFTTTRIMASNELDEMLIGDLKHQGAKIDVWGVGTHLVTGKGQSALDGVYKLSALQDRHGVWQGKLKVSEQMAKTTIPGILQVRRFYNEKGYLADMIYDVRDSLSSSMIDPMHPTHVKETSRDFYDLLEPLMQDGKRLHATKDLGSIRSYAETQLNLFHPAMRRFFNPQPYFCGLEHTLYKRQQEIIHAMSKK